MIFQFKGCMRSSHRSLTKDRLEYCHCSDEGSSNHRGSAHHQPRSGKHIDSRAFGHCFLFLFLLNAFDELTVNLRNENGLKLAKVE